MTPVHGNLALAEHPVSAPTLAHAIGMPVSVWLHNSRTIEQLLDMGFAELPIDPGFLGHYAPIIYDGLVGRHGIVNDPQRERFHTSIRRDDELKEDMESGLMRRKDDESKWQFHYHCDIEGWLRGQGAPVADFRPFWDSCKVLDDAAHMIGIEVGRQFDLAMSDKSTLQAEIRNGLRLTRTLDYLPDKPDPTAPDAKGHYDRGTLTVHWESTEPGLVVCDREGNHHRMNETNRGTVLLFWGRKFGLMYEHLCGIVGTPHGVRDTGRTTRGGTNRRAAVSFVHGTLTPTAAARYNANKAHYKLDTNRYRF